MAGVSLTHLVILVASLLIAVGVVGAAFTGVDQVTAAVEDRSESTSAELRTDVTIISDASADAESFYDSQAENVTVLVKNTGASSLLADPRLVDVLLNGGFVTDEDLDVTVLDEDGPVWPRGAVVEVEIATDGLSQGDHRVTLHVRGDREVFEFRLEPSET